MDGSDEEGGPAGVSPSAGRPKNLPACERGRLQAALLQARPEPEATSRQHREWALELCESASIPEDHRPLVLKLLKSRRKDAKKQRRKAAPAAPAPPAAAAEGALQLAEGTLGEAEAALAELLAEADNGGAAVQHVLGLVAAAATELDACHQGGVAAAPLEAPQRRPEHGDLLSAPRPLLAAAGLRYVQPGQAAAHAALLVPVGDAPPVKLELLRETVEALDAGAAM